MLHGVLWPATIPRRCSQRPPPRLGHVQRAVGSPSLASLSQAPSSRSAPPAPRGCGCSCLAGRLPGPRSARPPPPGAARPLVCKAPRPGLRHRLRASARACGPRRCGCCAPLRLVPRLRCLHSKSAARSSRSRRLRCRQGILPVKSLGGEVLRASNINPAQTFDGCPSLTAARSPRVVWCWFCFAKTSGACL